LIDLAEILPALFTQLIIPSVVMAELTHAETPGKVLHWRRMQKTFAAVYEKGVLRPLEPLALAESQRVSLTIEEASVDLTDDQVLDQELLNSLACENLSDVSLEEVQAALAKIPGSMTAAFSAEREERF
jgi:predicted DNA-binding antitoxin AbrB/MazE fold protein